NGTTTNPTGPLDRSEATFQTYPNRPLKANQTPGLPTNQKHTKAPPDRQFERESVAIIPHQRRRLE
ncbi:hypothetical protein ACIPYV_20730, partial [Paenarthrobacter nicotinovorans]|uniref:hypothetical protein n=1 Tax=Paenarthrobacter nicotinovorans TaxID=29320 RepID=UPI0037FDB7A7